MPSLALAQKQYLIRIVFPEFKESMNKSHIFRDFRHCHLVFLPMKQFSLAATDFVKKPKQNRREKFLEVMGAVVPWGRLLSVIEPHYPKAGNGRRPYELPAML